MDVIETNILFPLPISSKKNKAAFGEWSICTATREIEPKKKKNTNLKKIRNKRVPNKNAIYW